MPQSAETGPLHGGDSPERVPEGRVPLQPRGPGSASEGRGLRAEGREGVVPGRYPSPSLRLPLRLRPKHLPPTHCDLAEAQVSEKDEAISHQLSAISPGDPGLSTRNDRRQEPAPTHHSSLITHHSTQSSALSPQSLRCDVLVIGGAIAGLTAAIEARLAGADVIVASKGRAGRSGNTVISGSQLAAVVPYPGSPDSPQQHLDDTLSGGKEISDESLLRLYVER